MKYIEYPELNRLARALTVDNSSTSVHTKLEAYSLKHIKRDKRLFRSLESAYTDDLLSHPHSPPSSWTEDGVAEMTPFGPIDKHASRKTLYLLIATLNYAFPDYEFSSVQPSQFNKEPSGAPILNALSTTLVSPSKAGARAPKRESDDPKFWPKANPTSSSPLSGIVRSPYEPPEIVSGTHPSLYKLIDDVIGLSESEVFTYVPDIESDPHASEFEDDEDEVAELGGDEDGESSESEGAFEFDNYDIDEHAPSHHNRISPLTIPPKRTWSYSSSNTPSPSSPHPGVRTYSPTKRRGALLWSSHWFFLNRKLKRILFISVWAKTRGLEASWSSDARSFEDLEYGSTLGEKLSNERFHGWEGSIGAGARAMGLPVPV